MPSNVRAASIIKGQITHAANIRKLKFNKSHALSTELQLLQFIWRRMAPNNSMQMRLEPTQVEHLLGAPL
jgi:hypothetical protein